MGTRRILWREGKLSKIFSQLSNWRYWRTTLSIISSIFIITGLFGPWLWQPRPLKRAREIGVIYEVSPLFARVIEKGELASTFWFFNFSLSVGMSLSLIGIIVGAILSMISFGRWKVSLVSSFFYIFSGLLFFYSFGQGLSIGVWTKFGWGFTAAIIGGILSLPSLLINYVYEEVE